MLNRAWMEREAPLARCPLPACRRSGTCHHSTDQDPCRRLHETRSQAYNKLAMKLERMAKEAAAADPEGKHRAEPGTPEFEQRLKILYDALRERDRAESGAELAKQGKRKG